MYVYLKLFDTTFSHIKIYLLEVTIVKIEFFKFPFAFVLL